MFKKFHVRKGLVILLLFSIMLMAAGCQKNTTQVAAQETATTTTVETTLVVSAAASLKETLSEIAGVYEKEHPGSHLTFNFGATGALTQQIEQGAEVDEFVSASNKLMRGLEEKALLTEGSNQVLLKNKLVLVVPKDSKADIHELEALKNDTIKSIAVGEAKTVPAGQYALESFETLGLTESLKDKLVYGKDVKEVLTWVETGNVDAGLVYLTDALASDKVRVAAEVAESAHSPIVYPIGIIKGSKQLEAAQAFAAFLSTEAAQAIFEKYGFETNTK